ncbi:MAG: von Willebrand factor type A domain-containing protein [Anaerolineales bacterium]|nr:von Willebrand factor type A domain-containing protein [Anaerolineales bacterium]
MNAKRLIILTTLITLLLTACAPAATPTTIGQVPLPTQAPAATQLAEAPRQDQSGAPTGTYAPTAGELAAATAAPGQIGGSAPISPVYPTPAPTQPVDMFFQNYGVNPFVDAREDHLSTFAIDVDTAAYSLARNYVQQGQLPPADAIRVEEFVNYFRQDYPLPPDVAFGLYADGAPSPYQPDGSMIVRFGVQGYRVPEAQRQPLNLTLVIDVSGSMSDGGRLELVKQAVQLLVDRLTAADNLAVVAYSTEARVVLQPVSGSDRNTILNAVYGLYPENSTNAEAGLQLGYQMAQLMYRPAAVNRVILLSDGVANVGATGPGAILESIGAAARDYGIKLTSVGVGMGNFNDVLLEQLADQGDGNYAYVDDLDEARKLFVEKLVSTLQVIALDAKIQVDFNAEVVAQYRLIGYENRAVADQNFRNDAVDAGEIGAGHTVTALYAVQLRPGATGRLATLQLRWQDPQTFAVSEINGNVNTWDLAPAFEQASARYQLAVTVAQYAELLRRSPWAQGSSLAQVSGYANRIAQAFPEDADVQEFAQLVNRAWQLGW